MKRRPKPGCHLDALEWPMQTYVRLLGTRFLIRTDEVETGHAILDLLGSFTVDAGPVRRDRVLSVVLRHETDTGHTYTYRACEVVGGGRSSGCAIETLVAELNRSAIHEFGGFAVHAGVVASSSGALAFPGTSGAGKSTITASMLKFGWSYLSDEAMCFGADGAVTPYPKPIALSPWAAERLALSSVVGIAGCDGGILVPPTTLGSVTTSSTNPLRHLVRMVRRRGRARLIPARPDDGLAMLLEFSFNHYRDPRAAFNTAADATARADVWHLEFDDPLDAADLLTTEFR